MSILNFRSLPPGFIPPPGNNNSPSDNQPDYQKTVDALSRVFNHRLPTPLKYTLPGLLANSFTPDPQRVPGSPVADPSVGDLTPLGQAGSGLNAPDAPSSLADILAKLEGLSDPNRYAVDPTLLSRQARAAASAQYDPIIAQIKNAMGIAQTRANRNSQTLGSMFSGLSQSLVNDVAPTQQRYANTKQQTAQQYTDLQNNIKSQYADSQAQQEAMMRRLNIEAAAPDALAGQQSDKNLEVSSAMQQAQSAQSQLSQQEGGAVNYTQQGAEMARTEGTNRQADLMASLSDYLNQAQGQVNANEGAKLQSYLGQLAGLQTNSQKQAMDMAQRDFDNYVKVLGVMQQLSPTSKVTPVKSVGDIAPKALSMGIDANGAQGIQNVFMSAISSDPVIQAGIDPKFGVPLTQEALANRVVEQGRQQGLDSAQLNALQQIALEYFGRR